MLVVLVVAWVDGMLDWVSAPGWARRSWRRGQSMVEYAIVVALIALVVMGAAQTLGGGITQVFGNITKHLQGVGN